MAKLTLSTDPKLLATALRDKLGMSTGYASDLANGFRKPSLRLAVEIEQKVGIPVAEWTKRPKKLRQPRQEAAQQGEAA